jgi:hypothetical protein
MRLSKQEREAILRDYCARNGGRYDARAFASEVRATGKSHPAAGWFEWDFGKAAEEWWVEQARQFAQGIKIVYEVQSIDSKVGPVTVEYPALISPLESRNSGGGYIAVDPDDPSHLNEMARQAAKDLESWLFRYRHTAERFGVKADQFEKAVRRLRAGQSEVKAA